MGIVVIGAGQAGATLVEKLRAGGYAGALTLVGAEPHLPYQRPPLSKAYLLGEMVLEQLYLRPKSFYQDQGITLRLGATVTSIDRAAKEVRLVGGEGLSYSRLALTTGSRPRHLPQAVGGALEGVYTVRDLADVDAMAPEFRPGARVLIIGGGYIGLEAAAVAASKGLKVTLIEMAPRILQRVASPQTADYFRALHRDQDVDIKESIGLKRLIGDGRVTGALLTNGETIQVDFAIAGIGIEPETGLAEACGLEIENGIKVDGHGRTSDADIFAAGDCTSFPYRGERIRLESVPNAIDQAEVVARVMLDQQGEYTAKPWFWSDQYDTKLQIAGLNSGYDSVFVRKGTREGAVSHWYYRGDNLLAVDAMNDPRAYMVGKRMIEMGASPAPSAVVAPETDLKSLLKGL